MYTCIQLWDIDMLFDRRYRVWHAAAWGKSSTAGGGIHAGEGSCWKEATVCQVQDIFWFVFCSLWSGPVWYTQCTYWWRSVTIILDCKVIKKSSFPLCLIVSSAFRRHVFPNDDGDYFEPNWLLHQTDQNQICWQTEDMTLWNGIWKDPVGLVILSAFSLR